MRRLSPPGLLRPPGLDPGFAPRNDGAIGGPDAQAWTAPLPSLIRFIVTVGALVGLVYLGMLALVANVKVQPREMTQIVTLPKANP